VVGIMDRCLHCEMVPFVIQNFDVYSS